MPISLRIPFANVDMNYIQPTDCVTKTHPLPAELSREDLGGDVEYTHILPIGDSDSSQLTLKRNNQLARGFAMMLVRDEIKGPFLFEDISGRGDFQTGIVLFERDDITALNKRFPWLRSCQGVNGFTIQEMNNTYMADWLKDNKWIPRNERLRKHCEKQRLLQPKP